MECLLLFYFFPFPLKLKRTAKVLKVFADISITLRTFKKILNIFTEKKFQPNHGLNNECKSLDHKQNLKLKK